MTEFLLISTTVLLVAAVLMGVAVIVGEIDDRRRHDLAQLRREIDDLRRQIFNRHNL